MKLTFQRVNVNPVSSHKGRKAMCMKRKASPKVSPEMAAHIKFLLQTRSLYQHEIAALIGVNQGRISEVKSGKRHPGVAPARGPFPV